MAINKKDLTNVDNTNPTVYPNGQTKDNTGANDGTPLNNDLLSDKYETWDKLMRLYDIPFNGSPDNEANGFQYVEALRALASKNDFVLDITEDSGDLVIPIKLGQLKDNESIILKATVDKTTETNLKGSLDSVTKSITFVGDFKTGEYVRMINLASSVILIRMVDLGNIADVLTGDGSDNYLASANNNGLLNKDNFNSSKSILMAGHVASDGTVFSGTGFTSSKLGTGTYRVEFNDTLTNHIVIAQVRSVSETYGKLSIVTGDRFDYFIKDFSTSNLQDNYFYFIVLKSF